MTTTPRAVIFFDAGFTLIHPHPSVGHVYAAHARDFGVQSDPAALNDAFRDAWRAGRDVALVTSPVPYGRTDAEARAFWYAVVADTFRRAGHEVPTAPHFMPRLFDAFATGEHWRVYEDVVPALTACASSGVAVGVLSNWDARLRPVLAALGLAEGFDFLMLSCDAGAEKPDPAIFVEACRLVDERLGPGVPLALIGDEPDADGRGALAAGWVQCLVNRHGKPVTDGLAAANSLDAAVEHVLDDLGIRRPPA